MMNQRRKIVLATSILVIAGLITVFIFVLKNNADQNSQKNSPVAAEEKLMQSDMERSQQAASVVRIGSPDKKACDLLKDEFIASVIAVDTVKKQPVPTAQSSEYISTNCQYTADGKKVSIILYEYPDQRSASENQEKAANEETVINIKTRQSTVKSRDSIARSKGNFVISVAVSDGSNTDTENANKLIDEAFKQL